MLLETVVHDQRPAIEVAADQGSLPGEDELGGIEGNNVLNRVGSVAAVDQVNGDDQKVLSVVERIFQQKVQRAARRARLDDIQFLAHRHGALPVLLQGGIQFDQFKGVFFFTGHAPVHHHPLLTQFHGRIPGLVPFRHADFVAAGLRHLRQCRHCQRDKQEEGELRNPGD